MATGVFPCEDGHAQERSLLIEVLPTVVAGDMLIMDRNFCVRDFLHPQLLVLSQTFRRREGISICCYIYAANA